VAAALNQLVAELELADRARSEWLAHTAVTRDASERAEAELAARGAAMGDNADDAVTAEDWLAAHRAEQADSDLRRPITEEHDLAEIAQQRAMDTEPVLDDVAYQPETAIADVRDQTAEDVLDGPGRVPESSEARRAVLRAQATLAEIEQRRSVEQQRASEEQRVSQLQRWSVDDARVAADDHADAAF
jgi:hypothetical protein